MQPLNLQDPSPSATGTIHPMTQEPSETCSPPVLSSAESSRPQSQPSDVLPPAEREFSTESPCLSPEPLNDVSETDSVLESPTQLGVYSEAELQGLWSNSFYKGCWTDTPSDIHAAHLISTVHPDQWSNQSILVLLAGTFRSTYSSAFTSPWGDKEATSRILKFLRAVEKQMGEQTDESTLSLFQSSVIEDASSAFRLSIDCDGPDILPHASYFGAVLCNGFVDHDDEFLDVLEHLAQRTKGGEHFKAFRHLLLEAGVKFCSGPSRAQMVLQHAEALRKKKEELVLSLHLQFGLIDGFLRDVESRLPPYPFARPSHFGRIEGYGVNVVLAAPRAKLDGL